MKNPRTTKRDFKGRFKLVPIKILAPLIFGLSILVYTYWKTEDLLLGPSISLTAPTYGASFTEPLVELRGRARRIASLFLNGGKIFTDENGYFKEKLLLAEGHNIIKLEAADKFGRQTEKFLSLVYTPSNPDAKKQGGTAERPETGGNNQND